MLGLNLFIVHPEQNKVKTEARPVFSHANSTLGSLATGAVCVMPYSLGRGATKCHKAAGMGGMHSAKRNSRHSGWPGSGSQFFGMEHLLPSFR